MERFLGKITMFTFALVLDYRLELVVLFTGLGHIFDMLLPSLRQKVYESNSYQTVSQDIIYIVAYATFYLDLDSKKAFEVIKDEFIINKRDLQAVQELFFYFTDVEIKNKYDKNKFEECNKKLEKFVKKHLLSLEHKVRMFRIIEEIINYQHKNPSISQIEGLIELGNVLNIKYNRSYKADYEQEAEYYDSVFEELKGDEHSKYDGVKYSEFSNYSNDKYYNENQDYYEDLKSVKDDSEIKDAFKALGLKFNKNITLVDAKKAYKSKVKLYHPDILKAENASQEKLTEAKIKLNELNNSIDIVKKYLANS